jgi:rare lipoprotein A
MAGNRSPYTVLGKTYRVLPTELGYNERGVASWYGEKFHGHKTSNGEVFDMYQASAAHKSLPIPSFLRVTNLDNNRSIIVRVNDRGPFHGDRIIDLSYAAALKLGYSDRGTARVQLESIIVDGSLADRPVNSAARSNLQVLARVAGVEKYIQVGAFTELSRAQELSRQLRRLTGKPVIIRSVDNRATGVLHRVRVGPVTDPAEIRQITQSVVAANLGSPYTVTE